MRLPGPMGLSGLATWVPTERQTAEEAVGKGLLDRETADELGYASLPVARLSAPEMAVLAGQESLRAAASGPGPGSRRIGVNLHAWMHYQGHDLWSPPHYVADRLGLEDSVPVGVQQVCNGGAAALELAAARLLTEPELGCALVTTADRFAEQGFDRWRGDYGIAYGDGATALVLHPLRAARPQLVLHALSTVAAPHLERMHRGHDPFADAPLSHSARVDVRRTKKAFLETEGLEAFTKSSGESLRRAIRRCLDDAGVDARDPRLRYALMPRLGRRTIEVAYVPAVTDLCSAEIVFTGADTGHLGAGDAAAGLTELHHGGLLGAGEYALVVSAGAGFTWSCLLVGGA